MVVIEMKYLIFVFLISCSPLRKNYITLSESTCVDGTILNIDQAGCENFYWGTIKDGDILKIRCAYAPDENFWTISDFYAVPHGIDVLSSWGWYCEDRYVKMYSLSRGAKIKLKSE
jgi:hypothetical protein